VTLLNSTVYFLKIFILKIEYLFLELTNHISDTIKDIQNQINLSKFQSFLKEDSILETPKHHKHIYLTDQHELNELKSKNNCNILSDIPQITKKFGFNMLLPFQENSIKSLISKTSCMITQPNGTGKSTVYQILSHFYEGLIVVVTQKHTFLKKKLDKINKFVSWGSINPEITPQQQNEILILASQKKLKILFITAELFNFHQFSPIPELVVFEDPQNFMDIKDFTLNCEEVFTTKLLLCPLLCQRTIRKLKDFFNIQNVFPENVDLMTNETPSKEIFFHKSSFDANKKSLFKNSFFTTPQKELTQNNKSFFWKNVKWIQEEDKTKILLNFLKNNKQSNILIYCNSRKNAEEISILLNKQAIKSQIYNQNYMKNDPLIKILLAISSNGIDFYLKNLINHVIHYDFPLDLEFYLENIAGFNENCSFLGILSDFDYFHQRNSRLIDLIEREKIEFFIKTYLFEANKENFSKISANKTTDKFVNFAKKNESFKHITLKCSEICQELHIKNDVMVKMLQILEKKKVVRFVTSKVLKAAVVFKKKPEDLIKESGILKAVFYYSINKNGKFRFFLKEIEKETKIMNLEILQELKK